MVGKERLLQGTVKKLLVYLLLGMNLAVVLGLLAVYLSVYISPERWSLLSFFGLGYPLLLAVNVFFVLLWLLVKPRFIWGSLLAVVLGWGVLARYIQLSGENLENADLKVLSYNVNHFAGNGRSQQQATAREITRFLKTEAPDIICLQEVRLRKNRIFNLSETLKELDFINHYQYARSSSTFGSVTLTRYPIIYMDEIRFENSRNITIYTDVLIGEDTVRIFNVHLHSYGIDPREFSIIDSAGFSISEDLKDVKQMGEKLREGFRMRARQAEIIREYIEKSPYHVIVCGDLNDTAASYSYRQLRKGMKDAFVTSGSGIGLTYVGKLPSFRIDYIFYSGGFEAFNFQTHGLRQSDHLPVSCALIKK